MAQGEILNLSMPTTSPVQNQELEQAEEANMAENEDPGVGTERVLRERIAQLELEVKRLKEANEELSQQKSPTDGDIKGSNFSVNAFKSNPKLFRYYTGLPDYETFRIILESFGDNLVYIGSNTNASKITSADYVKKGPKRNLSAEQEFFFVLVRLMLGLLEGDIAYRILLIQGYQQDTFQRFRLHGLISCTINLEHTLFGLLSLQ